ncbi:hypothetical protein HMI55_002698 [Coelomomyces lativittatus]|nr:hypothetical protein HMI55_002698 [Coelomomyces lativittatus]KAJ1511753.1 hypothetical protein HMI56_005002 [Coelomomyces lativittatus]
MYIFPSLLLELYVRNKKVKYLYHTDDTIALIDEENDELVLSNECMQGWPWILPLLSETTPIQVSILNDQPVCAKLDTRTFSLEIEETSASPTISINASVKGVSYKPAFLKGGLRVDVPEFCRVGDIVEVTLQEESGSGSGSGISHSSSTTTTNNNNSNSIQNNRLLYSKRIHKA